MDMHLRVWSLNYRHPSRAEAYALTLLSLALREPVLPQWPLPGGVADFAIPTAGIILEIDDKSHKAKRDKDIDKRNKWREQGWFVISCTDDPGDIVDTVANIKMLAESLPDAVIDLHSENILGGRVTLRGDYYKSLALKRAAKKLKKEAKLKNGKAKTVAQGELPPARKTGGANRKAAAKAPRKAKA